MAPLNKVYTGLLYLATIACSPAKQTVRYSGEVLPGRQQSTLPAADPVAAPKRDSVVITLDPLQLKYGHYLRVDPATVKNLQLYYFIERWLNTPYKWGGLDERGIDCSAFLQRLFAEVYRISIPRTSVQQFFADKIDRFRSSDYLSEGDLVFFRTMNDKLISHVGLYLQNDMFVNSSSSKGVSIASLKNPYWKKRFVAAGRLKQGGQ